jgi:hypothetical protein
MWRAEHGTLDVHSDAKGGCRQIRIPIGGLGNGDGRHENEAITPTPFADPAGNSNGRPNRLAATVRLPDRGRSPWMATISPRHRTSSNRIPCKGSSLWKCIV